MRKEHWLALIVFLSLVAENDTVLAYYNEMWTPARLFEWFTYPLPIKVNVFQIACLTLLLFSRKKPSVAQPITRAIQVSAWALIWCVLYGLAQGGTLKPIYTQAIAWAFCLIFTLTAMAVLARSKTSGASRTPSSGPEYGDRAWRSSSI